ncbi:hypothetical protein [Amycolatopsis antarctica]|uniref:hypothetical protein n=1 Tax=Amycolatopsis antarctica TaxID=1854586 RepID=UPI001F0B267F|nr:hypothetical protein [Amycolatopsis antarctica]
MLTYTGRGNSQAFRKLPCRATVAKRIENRSPSPADQRAQRSIAATPTADTPHLCYGLKFWLGRKYQHRLIIYLVVLNEHRRPVRHEKRWRQQESSAVEVNILAMGARDLEYRRSPRDPRVQSAEQPLYPTCSENPTTSIPFGVQVFTQSIPVWFYDDSAECLNCCRYITRIHPKRSEWAKFGTF